MKQSLKVDNLGKRKLDVISIPYPFTVFGVLLLKKKMTTWFLKNQFYFKSIIGNNKL